MLLVESIQGVRAVFRLGLYDRSVETRSLVKGVRVQRRLKGDSVFLVCGRGDDGLIGQKPFDRGALRGRRVSLVG